ncbi:ADP-ribose 1''-phosphate phosphatase [Coniosporium apollinis]|uniref:ADP-ribose 1''-phosphate phosphatase n=1 Tax=Coniosporium apollinis TaxID=61459 RepID=A0ABQ9P563_9PEZI|nr:ADP-ribose 1''-phosphate phosphatase [Coniosporium apollinis]
MPRRAKRKAVVEGDEGDSKSSNPAKVTRLDDISSAKDESSTATTSVPNEQQSSNDSKSLKKLTITEEVGDIFDAPDNAVIIHACNCLGHWGAGIAAAFRERYPKALKFHEAHCNKFSNKRDLLGTAQLIFPAESDSTRRRHFVGCLFTSCFYGRKKDSPAVILENTGPAMVDLLRQIAEAKKSAKISEVRMCQINSGMFKVPWAKTKAVLEDIILEDGMPEKIRVFSLK